MLNEFVEAINAGNLQMIVTSTIGQIIIYVLALILFLAIAIFSSKNIKTQQLVYSGIAIAIATVLSQIKLFELPQKGTVTPFSMLFVILIAYWFGVGPGLLAGLTYGLLQLAIDGYVVHPVQLLLDFPLAFAALGLAGIFHKSENGLMKGLIIGIMGRFIFHFLSGYVFFAEYAPKEINPAAYSFMYNISYLAVEGFLTAIVLTLPAVESAMIHLKKRATANYR